MKRLIIVPLLALFFVGCNKKEAVHLDFNVASPSNTYSVNDTVKFNITGNPDQLTFYSGEVGHKYIYRERLFAESDHITLTFASNKRYGTLATQPNSMRLLASQKFSGDYSEPALDETEWVDISDAFAFSPIVGNDNYTSSGEVNLLSLENMGLSIDKSKSIYFAFVYQGITGTTQPRWWFNQFDINIIATDGQVLPGADIGSAGWRSVKLSDSPVDWVIDGTPATRIRYQGGGAAVGSNDAWIITSAINLTAVQPDAGEALKNMSTRMDEYSHVYTTPGTYTVTFVASNQNVYGGDKVVKELEITITP